MKPLSWGVLMLITLAGCQHRQEIKSANELCVVDAGRSASWAACAGKTVRVQGRNVVGHQHPITPLAPRPGQSGVVRAIQTYLGFENGLQLVLKTEHPVTCKGQAPAIGQTLVVTGILEVVDLGGPPGTRSSYRGYAMSRPTIQCP